MASVAFVVNCKRDMAACGRHDSRNPLRLLAVGPPSRSGPGVIKFVAKHFNTILADLLFCALLDRVFVESKSKASSNQ